MKAKKETLPIVIFAGGKSSRMGQDKALLPFGGFSTLSEFQYHRVSHFFSTRYLSTKHNKFNFNAKLILDTHKDSSPLVAILSVFETLKEVDEVFVLSVDTPLVTQEIFETIILENETKYDAIIAQSPNGIEPLCGIYKRSALLTIKKQLEEKNHKLRSLLKSLKTKKIAFSSSKPFTNLNYFEEYEEIYGDS